MHVHVLASLWCLSITKSQIITCWTNHKILPTCSLFLRQCFHIHVIQSSPRFHTLGQWYRFKTSTEWIFTCTEKVTPFFVRYSSIWQNPGTPRAGIYPQPPFLIKVIPWFKKRKRRRFLKVTFSTWPNDISRPSTRNITSVGSVIYSNYFFFW